jgi:hypothetical protein
MPDTDIAAQLKRTLRLLVVATLVLYLALAAVVFWAYHDSTSKRHDLQQVAVQTNTALCTLRGDLKQRVRSSEKFLAEHPNGIPGISAATIRSSLSGQKRTVASLAGLQCTDTR